MKMSVVLLLALALLALLRHRSAALRHWVLAASVACAAMMPLLEMAMPAWRLPLSAPAQIQPAAAAVAPPAARSNVAGATPVGEGRVDVAAPVPQPLYASFAVTARRLLPAIRLAGVAISLSILFIGLGRLTWLASGARRVTHGRWSELADEISGASSFQRRFLLLQSDHPSLLVTWGLALPKIILPAAARDWPDARARVVLSHELAHIRRGDWIVQMAAELLRAFYWFNPLLWIVCRRLRLESEHACDDEVMSGGMEGADYATHLLDLARALNHQRHTWFPAPAMARPSSLERRVRAMLNHQRNRRPITIATRFAIMLVLLSVTAAIAAAQNMFQTLSGTAVDATGRPVPGVTLILSNPQKQAKHEVISDAAGAFEFVGLPSGDYTFEARASGFRVVTEPLTLTGLNVQRQVALQVGGLTETVTVAVSEEQTSTSPPVATERDAPDLSGCVPTSVGGRIIPPRKIRDVHPQYPPQLRGTGTAGVVIVTGRIGLDGYITDIQIRREVQPDLANAAVAAIREWRYSQTLLNCTPVEVTMTVTTNFRAMPPLPPPPPAPARP